MTINREMFEIRSSLRQAKDFRIEKRQKQKKKLFFKEKT